MNGARGTSEVCLQRLRNKFNSQRDIEKLIGIEVFVAEHIPSGGYDDI